MPKSDLTTASLPVRLFHFIINNATAKYFLIKLNYYNFFTPIVFIITSPELINFNLNFLHKVRLYFLHMVRLASYTKRMKYKSPELAKKGRGHRRGKTATSQRAVFLLLTFDQL